MGPFLAFAHRHRRVAVVLFFLATTAGVAGSVI